MPAVEMRFTEAGLRRFTPNQVRAPAHSVDLITAVTYVAFLPADARALAVEVSMVAVSTVVVVFMAAVGVVKHTRLSGVYREFRNGEKYHAEQTFKWS